MTNEDLLRLSAAELADVFSEGASFPAERLHDTEYVGLSLGVP